MKKILLLSTTLVLVGCLVTETRKVEIKGARKSGDIWWRDPQYASSAAVISSGCTTVAPKSSDEEYFDEEYFDENSFRWPGDWRERHPQPIPAPTEPRPRGEVY